MRKLLTIIIINTDVVVIVIMNQQRRGFDAEVSQNDNDNDRLKWVFDTLDAKLIFPKSFALSLTII